MNKGRVFLVDDDPSTLKAMTRLLREEGFETASFQSAADFLEHHDIQTPGCAVVDIALGDCNGLDLYRALASKGRMRPTIFITGRGDIAMSVQAMKAGAIDFLTKPVQQANLIEAIRNAIAADLLDREERNKISAVTKRISTLTPREREVLVHVIAGRLNKEIAVDMGISEKTVKIHRGHVMGKMGVRSVAALVRIVDAIE
jgi:FixJ family two-component response regulator